MATKATTADLNTSTAKTTEVKEAPAKTTAEEVAVNKEANKKDCCKANKNNEKNYKEGSC